MYTCALTRTTSTLVAALIAAVLVVGAAGAKAHAHVPELIDGNRNILTIW